MAKFKASIDLANTKQSSQIADLKNQLERIGWKILEEEIREFEGIPRWEISDDIPNLIATWRIQKSSRVEPIELDFIAWYDMDSYETYTNDCSRCVVRNTSITLYFQRDRGLRNLANKHSWKEELSAFLELLNSNEKMGLT